MKIAVIGAGQVGATTALKLATAELGDVVLVDIVEGIPQGKGLDIAESAPLEGFDVQVVGTNDYAAIEGCGVVVLTAGIPRKPGMSRMDLLSTNASIVKSAVESIVKYAPDAMIAVVTNPLDVMTYVAFKLSGFESRRVFGMAGVLDSARFRAFIAMELNVSVCDIQAMVLGGHGDEMVPLPRYTTVSGIPITQLMDQVTLDRLVDRTRKGGAEIVAYLKTGSAYYAPASSVVQMVEAIVKNKRRVLPAAVHVRGEYGFRDICLGLPVQLSAHGIERILEIDLTEEERHMLQHSADAVKQGIKDLEDAGLLG